MIKKGTCLFTSESVSEGHPDKLCDQISDAILDAIFKKDKNARVACETYITRGMVVVGGEITTTTWIDIDQIARGVIKDVGYTHTKYGFDYETCAILNVIGKQSPDISQGVDTGGAGDQGLMIGYANNQTKSLMPLALDLSHKLMEKITKVRKKKVLDYLGPDSKAQVTIEFFDGKPKRIDTVVLSTQHTIKILDKTGHKITEKSKKEIFKNVIEPVVGKYIDKKTKILINPTGKFVIGGPQSDTGMTGRKIIVDTYGGACAHGGGAFSGKDPSKVDRSAAYMARYIAKNIVAAKLAKECTVQLAYAIGKAQPVGFYVYTHKTGKIADEKLTRICRDIFKLSPRGIIEYFNLKRPIYRETSHLGHFGRDIFPWEKIDKVKELLKLIK